MAENNQSEKIIRFMWLSNFYNLNSVSSKTAKEEHHFVLSLGKPNALVILMVIN